MPYDPRNVQNSPEKPEVKQFSLKGKHLPWKKIGLCVSALLLVYGAVRLTGYFIDLHLSRRTTQELREIAAFTDAPKTVQPVDGAALSEPTPTIQTAEVEVRPEVSGTDAGTDIMLPVVEYPNGYDLVPRIRELRKKSEYIIGWLTMDDLDEPVVHKDNTFFLDHDATGKKNVNGAIFMDEETNLLTRPYTILLYGHNMKTGALFGNLRKYEDAAYCLKHRLISFDTLYEVGSYEIFAVTPISLTPGKAKYVDLAGLQSLNQKTRATALTALKAGSLYQGTVGVSEEDQVLLLITCVGDDDERLVVAAKRL